MRTLFGLFQKFSFCLLWTVAVSMAFGETAFDAVKVVKNERGPAAANAICEIHGERGGPAPPKWILLLNDPKARSGVREIVVSQKKIISDRTPLAEYGGVGTMPALNIEHLALDSDGAFRIANEQAVDKGVGFHWLDYKLTRGEKGPVWNVHLTDYMGGPVGNISISADTGAVIRPLELDPNIRPSAKPRSEWVREGGLIGHAHQTANNVVHGTKKTVNKTLKFTEKVAKKTKEKVLNVTGNVQEWLTGKRTIDPNGEADQ